MLYRAGQHLPCSFLQKEIPMPGISADQEQQVKELATNGNKIAAIAQYREITGVGLKEAKEAVEALMSGTLFPSSIPPQIDKLDPLLEKRIKQLLVERKKIEAIRAYREVYRCGLKESKEAVDQIQAEMHREGYSNLAPIQTINNDPFASDAAGNRIRLIVFIMLFLLAAGLLAFIFLLRGGY